MSDISVILNVFKRPHTLEVQIEAIKRQTVGIKSENIHVWYNNVEGLEQPLPKDTNIKTYQCNYNTKFFGRFTIPLLCRTKYIAMFDDDIIPSDKWLENCLKHIKNRDGILGGSGVITNGKTYAPNVKYGWNGNHNDRPVDVDLVGHAWFFDQKCGKFMWMEEPPSWQNGEDMFLSFIAQKHGIPTYVPPHPESDKSLWSNDRSKASTNNVDWGMDNAAHSLGVNATNHMVQRNNIVIDLKKRGWKTIK